MIPLTEEQIKEMVIKFLEKRKERNDYLAKR